MHGKNETQLSTINYEHQVNRISVNRRSNLIWLAMEKPDLIVQQQNKTMLTGWNRTRRALQWNGTGNGTRPWAMHSTSRHFILILRHLIEMTTTTSTNAFHSRGERASSLSITHQHTKGHFWHCARTNLTATEYTM